MSAERCGAAAAPDSESTGPVSPWLTVAEAAKYARCGRKSIYNGVTSGKLQAARLGGRRELRFLREWVDSWLLETSRPNLVNATGSDGELSVVG